MFFFFFYEEPKNGVLYLLRRDHMHFTIPPSMRWPDAAVLTFQHALIVAQVDANYVGWSL